MRTNLERCIVAAVEILSVVAITACGSGGGSNETSEPYHDSSNISGIGSLRIDDPTSDSSYQTSATTVTLGGSSFTPPYAGKSPPPSSRPANLVTWENATAFDSGSAFACLACLLGTTWWEADIPLVIGANVITVTADDQEGNVGRATITVTRVANGPRDTIPPTVTSVFPAEGSFAAIDSSVVVEFSEPIFSSSVGITTVSLTRSGVWVPSTVYASANSAILSPLRPLASGAFYEITVSMGILDESGNRLAQNFTSYFRTQ